jgi:hypothetical protein
MHLFVLLFNLGKFAFLTHQSEDIPIVKEEKINGKNNTREYVFVLEPTGDFFQHASALNY